MRPPLRYSGRRADKAPGPAFGRPDDGLSAIRRAPAQDAEFIIGPAKGRTRCLLRPMPRGRAKAPRGRLHRGASMLWVRRTTRCRP